MQLQRELNALESGLKINGMDKQKGTIIMKCFNCGKEIPENSKFCLECGKEILQEEFTCKKCGQVLPIDAKFCNNCGESVTTDEIISSENTNDIPVIIKLKKQMMGSQPADIYIDDEFLGTLRSGDFINYNLAAKKASSEIKIRIAMLYLFNRVINLYITLKPNETEPKSITVFQSFNTSKPDVEITGFDVISRTQSGSEKYNSPKL